MRCEMPSDPLSKMVQPHLPCKHKKFAHNNMLLHTLRFFSFESRCVKMIERKANLFVSTRRTMLMLGTFPLDIILRVVWCKLALVVNAISFELRPNFCVYALILSDLKFNLQFDSIKFMTSFVLLLTLI